MADGGAKMKRRALVTGASSGIGRAFAERLAGDGYDLVVVARRQMRLQRLADQISEQYGRECQVWVADLTDMDDLEKVAQEIENGEPLDMLINNAGIINFAPVAELDVTLMRRMVELHIIALSHLCRAALPAMIARQKGDIINVASIGALFTAPTRIATYAATKAYINTFSLGLYNEVKESGIRVQALNPGFTYSELFESAGDPHDFDPDITMSVEALVDASLQGLELGEALCIPGLNDADLLADLMKNLNTISQLTMSNGTPAARYHERGQRNLS